MKIKTGVDICDVSRIKLAITKYGDRFINRILTQKEKEACKTDFKDYNYKKVAKRFAGKEAVAKAVGLGIGNISFLDIEILNNDNKAPYVVLSNTAKEEIKRKNNWQDIDIQISLSDDKDIAIASVVLVINNIG